jgi:hypothetical protein
MPVRASVLQEEIRVQEQRLRRVSKAKIQDDVASYQNHPVTRNGDIGRIFDFIAGLVGGGVLATHRQESARVQEEIRLLSYDDTFEWLSELEGTVHRAPDPMSDETASALRYTLGFIRVHIGEIEAKAR